MRGEHLRAEHEAAGIPGSPASFMRHHDLPFSTFRDIEEREAGDECFHAVVHDTPHDEAWRRHARRTRARPIWYECSCASMYEAYLPDAGLEWLRLVCRGDDANEVGIERGSPPRDPRTAPGYLSITAVAAISTRNSGLTRPACTQARAGGFCGKYDP